MTQLFFILIGFGVVVLCAGAGYYFFVYRKKHNSNDDNINYDNNNEPYNGYWYINNNNNSNSNNSYNQKPNNGKLPMRRPPPPTPPKPLGSKTPTFSSSGQQQQQASSSPVPPVSPPLPPTCPPPFSDITSSLVPAVNANLVLKNIANGFYVGINSSTGTGNTLYNTDPTKANAAVFQLVPIPSTSYYRIVPTMFTNLYLVDPDNASSSSGNSTTAAQLSTDTDLKSVWKLMLANTTTTTCVQQKPNPSLAMGAGMGMGAVGLGVAIADLRNGDSSNSCAQYGNPLVNNTSNIAVQNVSTGRVLGAGTETADRLYCYTPPTGTTYCFDSSNTIVKYSQFVFESAPNSTSASSSSSSSSSANPVNTNQVLTQTGPPAVYTQIGNNSNWIKYLDHSWSNYNCNTAPADTSANHYNWGNNPQIGKITEDSTGTFYAMLNTCVDSSGNMQGTLTPNPGSTAFLNMNCSNCIGSSAYVAASPSAPPAPPVLPPCPKNFHYGTVPGATATCFQNACDNCPNSTNWQFANGTCTPTDAATRQIIESFGWSINMSPQRAMLLFPEQMSGNTCFTPNTTCTWCPPGFTETSSKTCVAATPRFQEMMQDNGYPASTAFSGNQILMLIPSAGYSWQNSCFASNY